MILVNPPSRLQCTLSAEWVRFSKFPKDYFKSTKLNIRNVVFNKFLMEKFENFTRSKSMLAFFIYRLLGVVET